MSNVSTSHNITKLEKNSKPFTEQRLARVIAKMNKEGKYENENLTESKCVSIPQVTELTPVQLQALQPHVIGLIENAQDALIRDAIIESGASSVNDAQISVEECIKYLEESAKGSRVTSEYMQKWFSDVYGEPAMEFIAVAVCKYENVESLSEDQVATIEKRTVILRDMFTGFASGKYSPDIPKCKAIIRFGEFIGGDNWDGRMSVIQEKTAKMLKEKQDALSMDALGFTD